MQLSEDLEVQAEWRRQKAEDYPEDRRNIDAADFLSRLAKEVEQLERRNDSLLDRFEQSWRRLDDDDGLNFVEKLNNYHRRIGFWEFPSSGENYLEELIRLTSAE